MRKFTSSPRASLIGAFVVIALATGIIAQVPDPFFRMRSHGMRSLPPVPGTTLPAMNQRRSASANGNGPRLHDGTRDLPRHKVNSGAYGDTIPFWSDSFDYHKLRYPYRMVGTDPKKGSATTTIPVTIVPIRWVFADGSVNDTSTDLVDGQTAIQGMLNSPIFQDYDFTPGGTPVGKTQFGDAFQRANFWDSVSTRSPNYHVRLGTPTVTAPQTVNVPADMVTFYTNPYTGVVSPQVNNAFLIRLQVDLIASLGISTRTLPIIAWGAVSSEDGAAGWHGAYGAGNSMQTYIATGYLAQAQYGFFTDVSILGHEVIEWMDDPFQDNYSAGWNNPFYYVDDPPPVRARCDSAFEGQDLLETGDPFENLLTLTDTPVTLNGYAYHLPEGAFIDFFTRSTRSRSVNGQYSFFEIVRPYGLDTLPSSDCVSSVETENTFFTVPGSTFTWPTGLNGHGTVVGYYYDASFSLHGFVRDRGYGQIDYPGALATAASAINDSGEIVGYYIDANGYPHGFDLRNGRFSQIDFPGSADTVPNGINSAGDIVGEYNATQPITPGFILHNGEYQSLLTPYGTQAQVSGINNSGALAGAAWTVYPGGAQTGWTYGKTGFSRFDFPDSLGFTNLTGINNFGDTSGLFTDQDGFLEGLVTLYGYPYVTRNSYITTGINDSRQVVGFAGNLDTGRYEPFIGQEPLANNGK
ncbi:MAG: hypothetical protein ACJ73D_06460 [Pyrinomonadaceae bacterium]